MSQKLRNLSIDAPRASSAFRFVHLWISFALATSVLGLFWPALQFDYTNFDDPLYVRDNPFVNGLAWSNIRWAFTTIHENWWLPMLWISYMLDTTLFGPGPFGHHLTNILFHAANSILLFWVLSRMTKSIWPSAFVAALFALHPSRIEAVVWIAARKDMLSGFFFMCCLLAHLRYVECPSPSRKWILPVLMLLGLMSKAILITLPPILLLLDFWPLRRAGDPLNRLHWKAWGSLIFEKWPLLVLSAIFVMVNLYTHSTGRGDQSHIDPWTRLALIPPNFWAYVAKLLWPHPLSIIYPERDVANWMVTSLSLISLGLVLWSFVRQRLSHPHLLVGGLWFLTATLPVARGLRLGIASMADRFSYIPAIGLFILLAWTASRMTPSFPWRRHLFAACSAILLFICALSSRTYLPFWRDSNTLFRHALAVTHDNYVAAIHVAYAMNEQQQETEEIFFLRYALQRQPSLAVAHAGLARLLRTSDPKLALDHLQRASQTVQPREWDLHRIIGEQFVLSSHYPEAIHHFLQALQSGIDHPDTRLNLASAYLSNSQPVESLACADAVLRLHPRNPRAHFAQAQALLSLDRSTEAVKAFESAIQLDPARPEFKNALAIALSASGQSEAAVSILRNLLQQNKQSIDILNNLACLLAESPTSPVFDPTAALFYALQAAELTHRQDPRILDTLAMAYAAHDQCDLAIQVCNEAEPLAKKQNLQALALQIRTRAMACQSSP